MLKIIAMENTLGLSAKYFAIWALFLSLLGDGTAQMPSDVLVVVNESSSVSKEIANHYMEGRNIPQRNRLDLTLPRYVLHPERPMRMEDFSAQIWAPIEGFLSSAEGQHIQAVLFSTDFPVRVDHQQSRSLMGASMLKRKPWPDTRGPRPRESNPFFIKEFQSASQHPTVQWPPLEGGPKAFIPMMSLGVRGIRANTRDEILYSLQRSMQADYSAPTSEVWFASNGGIRSQAREKQVLPVIKVLREGKLRGRMAYQYPGPASKVMGIFTGTQKVYAETFPHFLPGAVCDHLTSFAAAFDDPYQDKLCLWLAAGAAAATGTVCEPYVIWKKFPHASFYVHYSRGHSILASYMKSVADPYQLLMVGDALCRPYAKALPHQVEVEVNERQCLARVINSGDDRRAQVRWLLDGRLRVERGRQLSGHLEAGWHDLRCRIQIQEAPEEVDERVLWVHVPDERWEWEPTVPLEGLSLNKDYPIELSWTGQSPAQVFRLMKGREVLAETESTGLAVELSLNPNVLGLGPSRIHWESTYEKGRVVRGPNILVTVK